MTTLLNMLLVNAVVVLPLAAVVWCASRLAQRPALTHVLWVLVLLKLITPPFVQLPFSIAIPMASQSALESVTAQSLEPPAATSGIASMAGAAELADSAAASANASAQSVSAAGVNGKLATSGVAAMPRSESAFQPGAWFRQVRRCLIFIPWSFAQPILRELMLSIWFVGSAIWFFHQAIRGIRFWRGIERGSLRDPKLQRQACRLATRLGLRHCPQVVLVEAQLSPMLWGYGWQLRLLFPADLARRLDHDARATLIAHELAHYSRGDHWIRVLELLVTGVFWWHPVVWLARHRIEESEEECCDAWVVSELPHAPRRYAEALLDTIDFLCDPPTALPPLASGLGPAAFLRRRLTRIMQGVSPKDLSARQRCGVLFIALLALPLQPFVLGSSASALRPPELPAPTIIQPNHTSDIATEVDPVDQAVTSNATAQPDFSVPDRPNTPAPRTSRSARGERIWGTAVSSNGRFAIQATTAKRVLLTNLATSEQSDLSTQGLTSVAFFPDGETFVAGGSDGRVTVWSAAAGAVTRTIYTHDDVVRSVAVAPGGDVVAIGGRDGSVHLLDVAKSQSFAELPRVELAVNCVRFSPDGRRLAVAIGDWESSDVGHVAIWNLESGRADGVLTCESAPGAVDFVGNDELIVGEWNGHTSLWNLVNRQVVVSAMADKNNVTASSFSPDNPLLREVEFSATSQPNDAASLQAPSQSLDSE